MFLYFSELSFISLGRLMTEKDRLEFIEFNKECAASAIKIFADNLSQSDKLLRTSTLRILSHFAHLDKQPSTDDVRPTKKLKTEPSGLVLAESQNENVCFLLFLNLFCCLLMIFYCQLTFHFVKSGHSSASID